MVLQPESQTLLNIFGKNPQERVHSQGRVLGDRSVLYKYVNPNLVAVVTQGTDTLHKCRLQLCCLLSELSFFELITLCLCSSMTFCVADVLNVYLLDVVSGAIVYSVSHKRAREPFHLVHTENWIVYTYFSEKWRRTEIAAIELYEGKTQSNPGSKSCISLDHRRLLPISCN